FSVDQNNSNKTEIVMSRHSLAEIGPSSFNCFLTNSVPPSISFSSGLIIVIITKYKTTDIIIDHGAAYKNHSPHDISCTIDLLINPLATIFRAAAVSITIFHIDTECPAVITSKAA